MVASTVVQPDPLPGAQSEVQADMADRDTAPAEPTHLRTPIDVRGAAQKVRDSLRVTRGTAESPIQKVQRAAEKFEAAAEESGPAAPATSQGVTRVRVERQHFDVKDYLWSGTLGLAGLASQATIVFFITYFLITSGDTFRRNMVRIAGPAFSQKKITIQVLDEITGQIQRYLLMQILTSVLVGAATWLTFAAIGLNNAAALGAAAAVLNLVPYLGAIVISGAAALLGFLQFGTLGMALLTGAARRWPSTRWLATCSTRG